MIISKIIWKTFLSFPLLFFPLIFLSISDSALANHLGSPTQGHSLIPETTQGTNENTVTNGTTPTLENYILLENYGGALKGTLNELKKSNPNSSKALASYIDFIIKTAIGFLSIGAVLMIIYAGILYVGSETFSAKSNAKDTLIRAIGSLVLVFSAFIFYNTLNPEFLKVRFKSTKVSPEKANLSYFENVIKNTDFKSQRLGWENICNYTFPFSNSTPVLRKCHNKLQTLKKNEEGKYEYYPDSCIQSNIGVNKWCYQRREKVTRDGLIQDEKNGFTLEQIHYAPNSCEESRKNNIHASNNECICFPSKKGGIIECSYKSRTNTEIDIIENTYENELQKKYPEEELTFVAYKAKLFGHNNTEEECKKSLELEYEITKGSSRGECVQKLEPETSASADRQTRIWGYYVSDKQ